MLNNVDGFPSSTSSSAAAAKARAKKERGAKEAEKDRESLERAKIDPNMMFRSSGEYVEQTSL